MIYLRINLFTDWLLLKEKNCDCEANLYEAKTSPMLKFIHDTNIKSCGWIHIDKGCYKSRREQKIFNCEHEYYDIDYKNIKIVDKAILQILESVLLILSVIVLMVIPQILEKI